MIQAFRETYPDMSISSACKTLLLSRSTYYSILHTPSPSTPNPRGRPKTQTTYNFLREEEIPDKEVISEIEEILSQKFVLYGYKKVTAQLRRRGYLINHKKVYRLMDEKGLLLKKFLKKDFFKKSQRESSEEVKAPDQKWSLDIKHFKTLDGSKGYVIAVKDCYTKEIVSHTVSRRHTAKEIEEVLYSALANRNLKELPVEELYVVSDNAKEIKSAMEELRKIGIKHVRITPYSPWENGEIESFFSCLEREVFWRFEIGSFEEAEELIEEYVGFYNNDRIHGGIGYKTPKERYLEFVTRESLANVSG